MNGGVAAAVRPLRLYARTRPIGVRAMRTPLASGSLQPEGLSSRASCDALEDVAPFTRGPFAVGTLGSSITSGIDVAPGAAWPDVLGRMIRSRWRNSVVIHNGAVRSSSADFAALCWEELWANRGGAGAAPELLHRAPRLDLVIIEYTWTSSVEQMEALLSSCRAQHLPVLALLYHHAPCGIRILHPEGRGPFVYPCVEPLSVRRWARLFERFGVPYVSNERAYSSRSPTDVDRAMANARHPSAHGHRVIAEEIMGWLERQCHLSPADGLRWSLFDAEGASFSEKPNDLKLAGGWSFPQRVCRIGTRLRDVCQSKVGFEFESLGDGRAEGFVAKAGDAQLRLHFTLEEVRSSSAASSGTVEAMPALAAPLRQGFLSVGYEVSARHNGSFELRCVGGCTCARRVVQTHHPKQFTFTRRSDPLWATIDDADGHCDLEIRVITVGGPAARCTRWVTRSHGATRRDPCAVVKRVKITALTLMGPLPGNQSVATNSLDTITSQDADAFNVTRE